MFRPEFAPERLSAENLQQLDAIQRQCTADILTMTTLAGCGHPGGSMSSLQSLLLLYANANIHASSPMAEGRDRIFVSHGHISPGTYSALAAYGFCDREEMLVSFRNFGSIFGGHVEMGVPGVEWNTGNLGQGLSAAVGSALGARLASASPAEDLRAPSGAAWLPASTCESGQAKGVRPAVSKAGRRRPRCSTSSPRSWGRRSRREPSASRTPRIAGLRIRPG